MSHPICYIVGAGENFGLDFVPREEDMLIAADGGYACVREAGLTPDLVIGDFDSLGRIPQARNLVVLPAEKDVTDTWAAIEEGKKLGYRRFYLYGCTGGRMDHSLANIQTVAHLAMEGLEAVMVGKDQLITAVTDGTLSFGPEKTGYVSVFSHSDQCYGVTLQGLKYEIWDASLTSDFPLGVSNEFTGVPSTIEVRKGTLVVVLERQENPRDTH